MTYRDLVLGRNVYIPSRVDFKNAILRSQLAVITMVVGITYIFIDHYYGIYGSELYYLLTVAAAVITLILNRLQRYTLATIIFLSLINLLIFYFSALDPYGSGVFMYFVVSSLMAFALLGYHDIKLAIAFILLSVVLFLLSYWVDFDFIGKRTYTEEYLRISYTLNFLICLILCIAVMYFLMDVNHHSEKEILAKNDQLEKANAELDRFVYSASHDLKAPLTSLLGLIEVAKLDEKAMSQYLAMMKVRIQDMEAFIREIISYSRNTRMEVTTQSENLKKIVTDVVNGISYAEHNRHIRIDNSIAENMNIHTDITRLKVVLSNLIANGLKYADDRKRESFINVNASQMNGTTVIAVKDNGIGIDNKYLDKIFNMFYRASEKSQGSGLGLYIVKETLNKINGTVRVESDLGEGSTFTVTLHSN